MESERRKPSGREKDEAAVKLLGKLQDQLHSTDASNRRRAAFNLSWMQEDGLEILKDALYGAGSVTTKNAAAYGLRKMRGRMKNLALNVLREGLKRPDVFNTAIFIDILCDCLIEALHASAHSI